jgi:hypothetical protein
MLLKLFLFFISIVCTSCSYVTKNNYMDPSSEIENIKESNKQQVMSVPESNGENKNSLGNGQVKKNCFPCNLESSDKNRFDKYSYQKSMAILLGICLIDGNVADEINYLLSEAIAEGDYDAMNAKGFLLVDGTLFGYRDYDSAIDFFSMAAKKGNKDAQFNLGFMYEHGIGLPQDIKTAKKFYSSSVNKDPGFMRLKNHSLETSEIPKDLDNKIKDRNPRAKDTQSKTKDIRGGGFKKENGGVSNYDENSQKKPTRTKSENGTKFKVPYLKE